MSAFPSQIPEKDIVISLGTKLTTNYPRVALTRGHSQTDPKGVTEFCHVTDKEREAQRARAPVE